MQKYKTCLIGCGRRGKIHAEAVLSNSDRLELAAICDLDPNVLKELADTCHITNTYTDAEKMLQEQKPELLCFVTMPTVRLPLIKLGIKYGVRAISFEKPFALDLPEAREMIDLCKQSGVKLIISHQQKYGQHWQTVKNIIDQGEIGQITRLHASGKNNVSNIGTHLIDYMIWFNGGHPIEWVVGHVHGTSLLDSTHPAPEYVLGQIHFSNGVRGTVECGQWAEGQPGVDKKWKDMGITVYGTHGYAKVITGNGWQAVTKSSGGKILEDGGDFNAALDQSHYFKDIVKWLDDPGQVHSCNGETSYHGFEVITGICLSGIENRRITFPFQNIPNKPLVEKLKQHLQEDESYD